MQTQSISNQPNFKGNAHFIGEISHAQKANIAQLLENVQLNKKPYDLFISQFEVTAQKASEMHNPVAPKATILINQAKDSIQASIKTAMRVYEDLTKH